MAEIPATAAGRGRHGELGVIGAAALVAGSMIGSGVYLLPATLGGVGSISVLGWITAGLVALSLAGVFIWLGPLTPQAKGIADYVDAGLGPWFGLQAAFLYWVSIWAGLVPVALVVAGSIGFLVPDLAAPEPRLALTVGALWLAVAGAWAGPRMVARIEGLTLVLGLAPVILAATVGWLIFRPEVFAASWNPGGLGVGEAVRASALNCFWAFLGLECAATAAGTVRDPLRNVPRATLLGVLGATALYMSATVVVMGVLPADDLARSDAPYADIARIGFGAGVGALIAAAVAIRCQGMLTGWTMVTAETSRSAADSGMFPALFRTRAGERAPVRSLLSAGVLMTALALLTASPNLAEQFSTLINIVSLIVLYCYVMTAGSLLRLSGRLPTTHRGPAILTALTAAAGAGYLIVSADLRELLASFGFVAAGAVLYQWVRRRKPA